VQNGPGRIVAPGAIGTLFWIGLVAWLPLCGAVYLASRGRCRSVHGFVYSILGLLMASPAVALGAGIQLNARLDHGAPEPHVTRVLAVTTSESRVGTSYSVRLQSWRPGWPDVSFNPPSSTGSLLEPGHMVKVMTRPGRFGWEWMSDVEPMIGIQPEEEEAAP